MYVIPRKPTVEKIVQAIVARYEIGFKNKDINNLLLDEQVCNLLDIDKKTLNFNVFHYLGHLNDKDGIVSSRPIKKIKKRKDLIQFDPNVTARLSGWNFYWFLSLRIRFLLEIIVKVSKTEFPKKSLPTELNTICDKLLYELSTVVMTFRSYLVGFNIYYSAYEKILNKEIDIKTYTLQDARNESMCYVKVYAEELAVIIGSLKPGKEFAYASGFIDHALYVVFAHLSSTNKILIRIDNLGAGTDKLHDIYDKNNVPFKSRPYIVAHLDLEDFLQKKATVVDYLIDICLSNILHSKYALPAVYALDNKAWRKTVINNPYPLKKLQNVGNCVVKNYNYGMHIRLMLPGKDRQSKRVLYKWVREQERIFAVTKKRSKSFDEMQPSVFREVFLLAIQMGDIEEPVINNTNLFKKKPTVLLKNIYNKGEDDAYSNDDKTTGRDRYRHNNSYNFLRNIENLVFQGGGVKGTAYLGVFCNKDGLLNTLCKDHIKLSQIKRVAGASAGAITSTLLAIGNTYSELYKKMYKKDFKEFLDDGDTYSDGWTTKRVILASIVISGKIGQFKGFTISDIAVYILYAILSNLTYNFLTKFKTFKNISDKINYVKKILEDNGFMKFLKAIYNIVKNFENDMKTSLLYDVLSWGLWIFNSILKLISFDLDSLAKWVVKKFMGIDISRVEKNLLKHISYFSNKNNIFTYADAIYRILWKILIGKENGLFSGDAFYAWIRAELKEKTGLDNITFQQLKNHSEFKKKGFKDLYIVALDLSVGITQIFSHEHTPYVLIADAVRASMSIPYFFKPPLVRMIDPKSSLLESCNGKDKKGQDIYHLYTDGGVNDNYPIWLFDSTKYLPEDKRKLIVSAHGEHIKVENEDSEENEEGNTDNGDNCSDDVTFQNNRTLGFRLVTTEQKKLYIHDNPFIKSVTLRYDAGFYRHLLSLGTSIFNKQESDHFHARDKKRTVYIDTCGVSLVDFDLNDEKKERLINAGKNGVIEYLMLYDKGFISYYIYWNLLKAVEDGSKYYDEFLEDINLLIDIYNGCIDTRGFVATNALKILQKYLRIRNIADQHVANLDNIIERINAIKLALKSTQFMQKSLGVLDEFKKNLLGTRDNLCKQIDDLSETISRSFKNVMTRHKVTKKIKVYHICPKCGRKKCRCRGFFKNRTTYNIIYDKNKTEKLINEHKQLVLKLIAILQIVLIDKKQQAQDSITRLKSIIENPLFEEEDGEEDSDDDYDYNDKSKVNMTFKKESKLSNHLFICKKTYTIKEENLNNLGNYGANKNYLYSLDDTYALNLNNRKNYFTYMNLQNFNVPFKIPQGQKYSYIRQNNESIFLSDTYYADPEINITGMPNGLQVNFANSFMTDIQIITGNRKGEFSAQNNKWSKMPSLLVLGILASGHYCSIRVEINYNKCHADILWSDPFGGRRYIGIFNRILPSIILGIRLLLRTHYNNDKLPFSRKHVQVRVKQFDQQGHNGTHCGVINNRNIIDYINPNLSNQSLTTSDHLYTLKRIKENYANIMQCRVEDSGIYRRLNSDNKTNNKSGVTKTRVKKIKLLIDHNRKQKLENCKNIKNQNTIKSIINKVKRIEPEMVKIFHQCIEQTRMLTSKNIGKPYYTYEEIKAAYEYIIVLLKKHKTNQKTCDDKNNSSFKPSPPSL